MCCFLRVRFSTQNDIGQDLAIPLLGASGVKGIDAICMFSDCENILAFSARIYSGIGWIGSTQQLFQKGRRSNPRNILILHGLSETKVTWMLI